MISLPQARPIYDPVDQNAVRRILEGHINTTTGAPQNGKPSTNLLGLYNVMDYGAKGDGVADDTSALQAAIAAANVAALADGSNGIVWIPPGTYQLNGQLVVPYGVNVWGAGARSTRIRVASTFANVTTTGAIRLGDGTAAIFGTSLRDLFLECGGITNSIGVYSSDVQDSCGLRNVLINNFGAIGVKFDGSAGAFGSVNDFFLLSVECYKANQGGTSGTGFWIGTGTFGAAIQDCVALGPSANPLATGYYAINFPLSLWHCNADGTGTDGVKLDTGVQGATIMGLVTNLWTNSLNIVTSGRVVAASVHRIGGTTTILDAGNGGTAASITSLIWPLYVRGENTQVDGLVNVGRRVDRRIVLTDAATVAVNALLGTYFSVDLTANRSMGAPTNATDGQEIELELHNTTAGAMTTTWTGGAGGYHLGAAWVDPGAGNRRTIRFRYNSTFGSWVETGRNSGDVT